MRGVRSAKFAEYASTYAILNNIGIHETTLIEKRDASTGIGVYVRDACDSGTTLLVVPAQRISASSVLSHLGTRVDWTLQSADTAELDDGLVTFLTGAAAAAEWMELCWRIALEQQRSYSHWWGWLESMPPEEEVAALTAGAKAQCRAIFPPLYPFYLKAQKRLLAEKQRAHACIAARNVSPPFSKFSWAVDVVLSRALTLPRCWTPTSPDAPLTELAVIPYIDLVNGPDAAGREANATVEVAAEPDDLPEWYLQWVLHEANLKGHDGAADLARVLEQRYCVCLTLAKPLRAAEEVILPYEYSAMTTGVLSADDDARLTRWLKYGY